MATAIKVLIPMADYGHDPTVSNATSTPKYPANTSTFVKGNCCAVLCFQKSRLRSHLCYRKGCEALLRRKASQRHHSKTPRTLALPHPPSPQAPPQTPLYSCDFKNSNLTLQPGRNQRSLQPLQRHDPHTRIPNPHPLVLPNLQPITLHPNLPPRRPRKRCPPTHRFPYHTTTPRNLLPPNLQTIKTHRRRHLSWRPSSLKSNITKWQKRNSRMRYYRFTGRF